MSISTEELGRWISDDRNHGVNINSGVLNNICAELITARAKIEAAEKLAEAADSLLDAILAEDRLGGRSLTIQGSTAALKWLIEAEDDAKAALTAWESLK